MDVHQTCLIHYSLDNDYKAEMGGVHGWSYLVEMPIVMESIQKNHSTPQQPILPRRMEGTNTRK